MSSKKSKQPPSFEGSYRALEELVSACERGDMPLDEVIKNFEQGLLLAADLQKRLEAAEQKITEVQKKFSTLLGSGIEEERA